MILAPRPRSGTRRRSGTRHIPRCARCAANRCAPRHRVSTAVRGSTRGAVQTTTRPRGSRSAPRSRLSGCSPPRSSNVTASSKKEKKKNNKPCTILGFVSARWRCEPPRAPSSRAASSADPRAPRRVGSSACAPGRARCSCPRRPTTSSRSPCTSTARCSSGTSGTAGRPARTGSTASRRRCMRPCSSSTKERRPRWGDHDDDGRRQTRREGRPPPAFGAGGSATRSGRRTSHRVKCALAMRKRILRRIDPHRASSSEKLTRPWASQTTPRRSQSKTTPPDVVVAALRVDVATERRRRRSSWERSEATSGGGSLGRPGRLRAYSRSSLATSAARPRRSSSSSSSGDDDDDDGSKSPVGLRRDESSARRLVLSPSSSSSGRAVVFVGASR
mmetsp:Transcript_2108/g.8153  ORF Transcript_2108/g.8153 Transcript_2108/m.8153 type:complete len:389 (-) Transcript_2108:70-1236(-)